MPIGAGTGGGGSAIRAGRAFVELALDDNKILRGLDNIKKRFSALGSSLRNVGGALIGLGSTITAPLLGALRVFEKTGDALDKLAGRTGLSVEFLSALDFAAQRSGSSIEQFELAIRGMQRSLLQGAGPELQNATGAIKELGLSLDDVQGKSPEEQFLLIADALSSVEDISARAGLAMRVFGGRAGTGVMNLIAGGAGGVKELMDLAKRRGLVVTKEEAKNAADLEDAMTDIKLQIRAILMQVGGAIAGPVTEFLRQVADNVPVIMSWVQQNRELIRTIALIGGAITLAGGLFLGFGIAASGVAAAIGGFMAVLGGIKAVLLALLSPVGLIVAAVVGLSVAWATLTPEGRNFVQTMKGGFMELLGTVRTAWGGIVDALSQGDFQRAGQIAFTALKVEWAKVILFWTDKWNQFKGFFVDGWHDATKLLYFAVTDTIELIQNAFLDMFAFIARNFKQVLDPLFLKAAAAASVLGLDKTSSALREFAAIDEGTINASREQLRKEAQESRNQAHALFAEQQAARDVARDADFVAAHEEIQRLKQQLEDLARPRGGPPGAPAVPAEVAAAALKAAKFSVSDVAGGLAASGLRERFGIKAGTFEKQNLEANKKTAVAAEMINRRVADVAKSLRFN